jgi:hypothetical protein
LKPQDIPQSAADKTANIHPSIKPRAPMKIGAFGFCALDFHFIL